MFDLLAALVGVIVEAILKVFTSQAFMKIVMATMTYVFLFSVIPLLIHYLVPQSLMNALSSYSSMLSSGSAQAACSGSQPVTSGTVVSCSTIITMVEWGQGIAYILSWFQFGAALEVFLPAMAVAFLFRRI